MGDFDGAPQLSKGDEGAWVEALQRTLEHLNHDPQGIDGDFGPRTEAAVESFQTDTGLVVDGIVGPNTWAMLDTMSGLKGLVSTVSDAVSDTVGRFVPGGGSGDDDDDDHRQSTPARRPSHTSRSDAAEDVRELYQLPDDWQLLDRVRGVFLDIGQSSELIQFVPVVNERCEARIGHAVSIDSVDDMLEWLADFEAMKAEVAAALVKVLDKIERANDNYRDAWKMYDDEWNGNLVAEISEFFGGAVELDGREFEWVSHHITESRSALEAGRMGTAVYEAGRAAETYELAKATWLEFSEKRLAGAESAVSGLTIVRDGSFTIVAGLATGGAATALETGIVGTAIIGGVVTTGVELVQSSATFAGHVFAGTTEQFDVTDELLDALQKGAEQFAGGAVAGWAAKGFGGKLASKLVGTLGSRLGPSGRMIAEKAVTSMISQVPGSLAQVVVTTAGDVAKGKRFNGTEEFLSYVGDEFLDKYVDNLMQDVAEEFASKRVGDSIAEMEAALTEALEKEFAKGL